MVDNNGINYKKELQNELHNQRDIAERFTAHANAIWNAAFPDDIDGWEYGAQLERCVIGKLSDQFATITRFEDGIEKIKQHLAETEARIETRRDMLNENYDTDLAAEVNSDISFKIGLKRALALLGIED